MNNDEIRRQLREAEAEQREALPRWRTALHRIFEDKNLTTRDKADLLGVPARRQFLKIGGATVAGAAVLAACSSDNKSSTGSGSSSSANGTNPSTDTGSSSSSSGGGSQMDLVLAKTAVSLENLAVAVYDKALGLQIQYDAAVADAAKLFRDQHQQHADQLNSVLTNAGQPKYTDPNTYILDNVVTPALPTLTDQTAVVKFAMHLEANAASTYAYAAGKLSTTELRQAIMAIGGVESRHFSALSLVLAPTDAKSAVPLAFTNTEVDTEQKPGRVPDAAILS